MGTADERDKIYAAIEETAALLDVTPSRETLRPILDAYDLPSVVVAFRATTRETEDFDCRFTALPGDVNPYTDAVAKGIAEDTDHPVGRLLTDVMAKLPVVCHGVDFGVVGGFKKTWTFLPMTNLQKVSTFAELPSAPPGLAGDLDFYRRYGLDDKLSMVGVDYPSRTVNIYFVGAPATCREPETIRAMLRDLGLPEPSEQLLELAQQAVGIYTTLDWDSPKAKRITFATMVPEVPELPARIAVDPRIEKFASKVGHTYATPTAKGLYNVASYAGGEYFKLQTYYQLSPGSVEARGILGPDA